MQRTGSAMVCYSSAITATADEVDDSLVEDAVRHIRMVVIRTVQSGTVEIGNYLLDRFFDGDVESVMSRSPRKSASFRSLAKRCGTQDLPISKSWLHNAVGIAVMQRALPTDAKFRLLSVTHQTVLLPLRQPNAVETVARRALDEGLSTRELRDAVREECRKSRLNSSPSIVETVRAIRRHLRQGRSCFSLAHIDALSEENAARALEDVQKAVEELTELMERLEARNVPDARMT